MLLILVFIFITSCSSIDNNIDPNLMGTYNKFNNYYLLYTKYKSPTNIHIQFVDIEDTNVAGYYNTIDDTTYIDRITWFSTSIFYREALLFHEMGHHILRRKHNTELLYDGCPESLMYPHINEPCYRKHKQYYIEELFTIHDQF